MQHFFSTWFQEGPLWALSYSSGWDTGGHDVLVYLGASKGLREPEVAGWEDSSHFWSHLDNRASRPPCMPIGHLHVN